MNQLSSSALSLSQDVSAHPWLETVPRLPFSPRSRVLCSRRIEVDLVGFSEAVINDLFQCGPTEANLRDMENDINFLPRLREFIYHICFHARLSKMAFTTAIFYLMRLKRFQPQCRGVYGSGHRLFLAAVIISTKYLYDDPYDNRSWVNVLSGRFDLAEINQMEMELLQHLKYQLFIRVEEYIDFLMQVDNDLAGREDSVQFNNAQMMLRSAASNAGTVPHCQPSPALSSGSGRNLPTVVSSAPSSSYQSAAFSKPPLSPPETDADSLSVCSSVTDVVSFLSSSSSCDLQPTLSSSSSSECLRMSASAGCLTGGRSVPSHMMPPTPQEVSYDGDLCSLSSSSVSSLPCVSVRFQQAIETRPPFMPSQIPTLSSPPTASRYGNNGSHPPRVTHRSFPGVYSSAPASFPLNLPPVVPPSSSALSCPRALSQCDESKASQHFPSLPYMTDVQGNNGQGTTMYGAKYGFSSAPLPMAPGHASSRSSGSDVYRSLVDHQRRFAQLEMYSSGRFS